MQFDDEKDTGINDRGPGGSDGQLGDLREIQVPDSTPPQPQQEESDE